MLIDLHNHTRPKSDDSSLNPEELVAQAKEAGLDGLCLTEHDWFWGPAELERLSQKHGLLVLPGVEITTEEGHLLVFGLSKYAFGMHHAHFVRQQVDQHGGVMIVAHPYRRQFRPAATSYDDGYFPQVQRACENPIFLLADAVEGLNGRATDEENAFSRHVSEQLGKRTTGGSDAHDPGDVGRCATSFERQIRDIRDLITEIKAGHFRPVRLTPRSSRQDRPRP